MIRKILDSLNRIRHSEETLLSLSMTLLQMNATSSIDKMQSFNSENDIIIPNDKYSFFNLNDNLIDSETQKEVLSKLSEMKLEANHLRMDLLDWKGEKKND